MTTRRTPRADARENRDRLLQAGKELLIEVGPATTVAAIAQRAGLSVTSFFTYFASKDELVRVLLTARLEAALAIAQRHARAPGAPIDRLEAYIWEAAADAAPHRAYIESATVAGTLDPANARGAESLQRAVAPMVAQAQTDGTLRTDVDARDILVIVSIATHAATPYLHARPDLWRRFVAFYVAGLRADRRRACSD